MNKFKSLALLLGIAIASTHSIASEELWKAAKSGSRADVQRTLRELEEKPESIDLFWRPSPAEKHIFDYLRIAMIDDLARYQDEYKFDKDHFNKHPEEYFFVGPSSIPGNSGFGLYVKKELPNGIKSLPAGLTLPHSYLGETVDYDEVYNPLNDFLVSLTVKYDGEKNLPFSDARVKADLAKLKKFGVTVSVRHRDPMSKIWKSGPAPGEIEPIKINWDRLYDNFLSYAFQVYGKNDQIGMIFANSFSHDGEVAFEYHDLKNMLLVANEPPPNDFINLYTLKLQSNNVSLIAEETAGKTNLRYRTSIEVEAGEELFLAYGPEYTATRTNIGYRINLSRQNGCGMYDLVASYLETLDEEEYLATNELVPYRPSGTKKKLYNAMTEYFSEVSNYQRDPKVVMADLDEAQLAWFSGRLGKDYAARYRNAKRELNGEPEVVELLIEVPVAVAVPTAVALTHVEAEAPAQDELELAPMQMSPIVQHEAPAEAPTPYSEFLGYWVGFINGDVDRESDPERHAKMLKLSTNKSWK